MTAAVNERASAARPYFDLMAIEQATPYLLGEQGIASDVARHRPQPPEPGVAYVIRGLGYFDDVADDLALPVPREEIERYWRHRQPRIVAALAKNG